MVAETAALFGRTRKSIRIHETYEPDICLVSADRGQIEQVLINLYLNAWQAMSEQGDLSLETRNVTIDKDFVKPFDVRHGNYRLPTTARESTRPSPTGSSILFLPPRSSVADQALDWRRYSAS